MKFGVEEIALIVANAPEFKVVSDEMLCANDGTYEQTLTKNDSGFYEWVVTECEDPDPYAAFDMSSFRELETIDSLLKFLKGE